MIKRIVKRVLARRGFALVRKANVAAPPAVVGPASETRAEKSDLAHAELRQPPADLDRVNGQAGRRSDNTENARTESHRAPAAGGAPTEAGNADGRPIAILGYDHDTIGVLRVAIASGFRPVALHASNGSVIAGTKLKIARSEVEALAGRGAIATKGESLEIDVIAEDEFARVISESRIPVVIGSYGLRERDYFREHLQFARNRLKFSGQVLHPAFLCDFHRYRGRRFAVAGFPGSGNMIIQNICWKLIPPPSPPIWAQDPLSAVITQFALAYWYSLSAYISHAFDNLGRWQDVSYTTSLRYGAINIALQNETLPTVISGLPQRGYAWSNPWHASHEPITRRTVSFYAGQRIKFVGILRHPLDIIVSTAAKMATGERGRAPQLLLQNEQWMDSILNAVEAYYAGVAEHKNCDDVHYIRYWELLASPVSVIRRLADALGVRISDKACRKIWESVGFKQVTGKRDAWDPQFGHLWDPRAGKWRQYIPLRFAERICNSRLRQYAEAVGFVINVEDFKGDCAELPPHSVSPLVLAWKDAVWQPLTGKQPVFNHPELCHIRDQDTGLLMIFRRNAVDTIDELRRSPLLRDYLSAAAIENWPEAQLVSEAVGLK